MQTLPPLAPLVGKGDRRCGFLANRFADPPDLEPEDIQQALLYAACPELQRTSVIARGWEPSAPMTWILLTPPSRVDSNATMVPSGENTGVDCSVTVYRRSSSRRCLMDLTVLYLFIPKIYDAGDFRETRLP